MQTEINGEDNDDSISHYYNEDFESDSDDENVARKKEQNILKTKKDSNLGRRFSDTQATLSGNRLKRSSCNKPLVSKRNSNQNEEYYVTQRLLSARKHKITELRNEIMDLERQLKEVSDENRLLKRLHVRQEKELMKLDAAKSELPDIMRSHKQELQALRKQLRRQKEKNRDVMKKMKANDVEILRLKGDLKVLNQICQQKDLMEREELQKKVESLEQQLSYQTATSQEYVRKLDLASKIRKQEIAAEKARFKQTKDMLDQLQHRCEELNVLLKDKELKLERNFIYSKRERNPFKSTKCVESFVPESQEKFMSPLPIKHTEENSSFNTADEQHNNTMDFDYDCINNIQNDDYWPHINEGERHEAISQGEHLLHNISKPQLQDSILAADDKEKGNVVSENIEKGNVHEKDKPLFPVKSASAESLGSVGLLTTVGNRSYSSLALTSFNQSDQHFSKENVTLHHTSHSKSLSLFSQSTLNHDHGDAGGKVNAVDLEDNLVYSRASSHRKNIIDSGHILNEQNKINSKQSSPISTLTNKIYSPEDDIGVDSDNLPYQSALSKRQDDSRSSWLPDIFQQSVNLH